MDSTRMNRLIIIGASGHGKVVADIAKLVGYTNIVFLDDNSSIKECAGYPVIGNVELLSNLDGDVFVAVGNSSVRKKLMENNFERFFPTLIHPRAVVAENVSIGDGTVVMAGVVINSDSSIGRGCIINTSSSVDHDCVISNYVHISVGAHIAGTVYVGQKTWVGAGSTISNNISICAGCMIGAGAVVIHNIFEAGTYIGIPVHQIDGEK